MLVHPHLGVWIEIRYCATRFRVFSFTPTWGCGLKSTEQADGIYLSGVHPHLGVWIEISNELYNDSLTQVHPHLGVWIEIPLMKSENRRRRFTPTWGCGLKFAEREKK